MARIRSVVAASRFALWAIWASLGLSSVMLAACSRPQQAPAVDYTLLDGQRASLAALRGRVVLVNFWSTDCAPCVEEMPRLSATWRAYAPRGFEMLAVSMSYDPPFAVANFAESRRLPFSVVIDNTGEIAHRFGDVRFTPTTVLINKRGEIVGRWLGSPDFAALNGQIERLLDEA
jgi:peroxiredoxin